MKSTSAKSGVGKKILLITVASIIGVFIMIKLFPFLYFMGWIQLFTFDAKNQSHGKNLEETTHVLRQQLEKDTKVLIPSEQEPELTEKEVSCDSEFIQAPWLQTTITYRFTSDDDRYEWIKKVSNQWEENGWKIDREYINDTRPYINAYSDGYRYFAKAYDGTGIHMIGGETPCSRSESFDY